MSSSIVFIVDLEAAGAPPAADTVRQLLALIDELPKDGGDLDWRLLSVSLNSPLRAEIGAFDRAGETVSGVTVADAAERTFALLDATNDNDPDKFARTLGAEDRRRLKALLQPMKNRSGLIQVVVPGRFERVVRADRADKLLTAITKSAQRRSPEMGSIEGVITSAATYYNSPAVKVRSLLTGAEVLCVFEPAAAAKIGASHTLDEIWRGRRVVVSGKISFDAARRPQIVYADEMRVLAGAPKQIGSILDAMHQRGDEPTAEPWEV